MKKDRERRLCWDRREEEAGPPKNLPERRRAPDRRRPVVTESTFFEWASLFVKYKEKLQARAARKAADMSGRSRWPHSSSSRWPDSRSIAKKP